MSLTRCRECKEEVSDLAASCPHCGAPQPARQEWKGSGFEWKSEATWYGYPLVHIAVGRDAKGKLRVAKGIIAIGQFAIGLVTIAQFGVGILFGFGQFILGFIAIAQVALGIMFGLGQLATGYTAIGQVAIGLYALGQIGIGRYIWSPDRTDKEAVEYFQHLYQQVRTYLGK